MTPITEAIFQTPETEARGIRLLAPDVEIFIAAALGCRERVETLLKRVPALATVRTPEGKTLLRVAAQHARYDVAALLLARGAEIDERNGWGETLLHWAAQRGTPDLVRFLLAHGADPDARDLWGKTPLDRALDAGRRDLARLLQVPKALCFSGQPILCDL